MSNEASTQVDDDAAASVAELNPSAPSASAGMATGAANDVVEMEPRNQGSNAAAGLFPRISQANGGAGQNDIDMVMAIPVALTVELGRTKLAIGNVLQLAHGSVIELDALASEPMDVYVNGLLIAQGEVVIVNEKFGLRLTDIVTPAERTRRLSKR
jgi:flagellar motor switch protein FliN